MLCVAIMKGLNACGVDKIPTILSKLYIYRADEGFALPHLEFSAGHDGCLGY